MASLVEQNEGQGEKSVVWPLSGLCLACLCLALVWPWPGLGLAFGRSLVRHWSGLGQALVGPWSGLGWAFLTEEIYFGNQMYEKSIKFVYSQIFIIQWGPSMTDHPETHRKHSLLFFDKEILEIC